jgi:hypothetical protein
LAEHHRLPINSNSEDHTGEFLVIGLGRLERVGAHHVVFPKADMGKRVAIDRFVDRA